MGETPAEGRKLYRVNPDKLRFGLVSRQPYLRTAVFRLRPVPQENMDTFAVDDGWRWYYGTEVPFTPREQITVLFHEVNHLLRKHPQRMGAKNPKVWNIAADAEINDCFPPTLDVPDNIVFPKKFKLPDGKLSEWYYERMNAMDVHVREDATALCSGSGPCETDKNCDSQDKPTEYDKDNDYVVVSRGRVHAPKCGSAGGERQGFEKTGGEPAVGEVEAEAIRKQVAEEVARHPGNAPGNIQRWADELLHPKVRWEKLLKTFARRASIIISGNTDLTYQKPSRREYGDFILPKRVAKKSTVAFYVDTSGSITSKMINKALAEVRAAIRSEVAELTVSFVDAEIQSTVKVKTRGSMGVIAGALKGGGGTDMRKCFEHYKTLRPKPNMIVVLTDGYTPWPDHAEPGVHTIVCIVQEENRKRRLTGHYEPPPWAKVIYIDETEEGEEDD